MGGKLGLMRVWPLMDPHKKRKKAQIPFSLSTMRAQGRKATSRKPGRVFSPEPDLAGPLFWDCQPPEL